ncbi:DUF2854 domain-containing protein [Leptolyngbya sp. O-77]|uniref:DUF2854 domain-containing protein n=1 Tax=Leptolyngbya sp. O-77 TaxID=1080068 RepID=UPI00074D2AE2|nr:DUF2854 domain-containing protein [Leptolyngbya sp. O-77]BAU42588.1 hypothetical protein O77CONTIG1_02409 [Leptolyngbya sp. O-77]
MLGRISLGTVGLVVGGLLTVVGFIAYFSSSATLNLVGFFYGIPLLLGGLALKISELPPVPYSQPPSAAALALRDQQATETQHQIRKDVTRYRYGQSAHLDSSLESLGLEPTDDERPVLVALREEDRDGAYALVLEFESEYISLEKWNSKREKIERFFGPGLRVEISQPGEDYIDVALISTGAAQA